MSASATNEYVDLLRHTALFRGLDRVTLAKLAAYIEPIQVSIGDTLFREGDAADGVYVITRGRLGIYKRMPPDSCEVRVRTCHAGEAVGEIALLTGWSRTATVKAESDSELLRVNKERARDLVQVNPSVSRAVSDRLIAHLRPADEAVEGEAALPLVAQVESCRPSRQRQCTRLPSQSWTSGQRGGGGDRLLAWPSQR
jgi:CRP-like cAMP-binding protein